MSLQDTSFTPGLTSVMTQKTMTQSLTAVPFHFHCMEKTDSDRAENIYYWTHLKKCGSVRYTFGPLGFSRQIWALKALVLEKESQCSSNSACDARPWGNVFSHHLGTRLGFWTLSALIRLPLFTSQTVCCVWWEVGWRAALRSARVNEAELLKMFRDFSENETIWYPWL